MPQKCLPLMLLTSSLTLNTVCRSDATHCVYADTFFSVHASELYQYRYFTEDCPVLLFTFLPLTVLGAWLSPSNWHRAPFWLAVWELIFHSVLSHKEHRYVFPIVPVGMVYAGLFAHSVYINHWSKSNHNNKLYVIP